MKSATRFANDPRSARLARRFVSEALQRCEEVDFLIVESVALMVSELASNCIRHTDSEFTISVAIENDAVVIEVTDLGKGLPSLRSPNLQELSGRGLEIVSDLSDDWGVKTRRGGTTTVWFSVCLDQDAASPIPRTI